MKIFVMVDMEGISGIVKSAQVSASEDPGLYAAARRYLCWDVNACVRGCIAGGAEKITVRDAHGSGFNFIWEELDPRAEYIQGSTEKGRMPGIAEYDGLILLGYHAMAGTREAILEHTMSSKGWQNFWINGRRCGELAIDAGIAGDAGVPTILVSGDDKVCREARAFLPGVVTAQVKVGLGCQGGILLPKDKAHAMIEGKCAEAVAELKKNRGRFKPFKAARPVRMRLELVSRGRVPNFGNKPWFKQIDGRTYEVVGGSVEEALARL